MIASGITNKLSYRFTKSAPEIRDFMLLSSFHSPTRNITLHQYAHKKTRARVYHFDCEDEEQAFASVVKTYVENSKGCPHILQHLACCGSTNYPIRDPFFNMIKRSVNTYMNAWTGDDFTAYPFATPNPADYRNLYQVYLAIRHKGNLFDMSLRPLLNRLDFLQEGWRYQVDEQGQQLKGIVLNEMKGAYQDSDRQLILAINERLFQGTPYAFDTGGNPVEIPKLGYAELVSMYQHYYHPSNMAFYYYGRDIASHLGYLSEQYLSNYSDQTSRYQHFNLNPNPVLKKYADIVTHTSQCNNISINYLLGQAEAVSSIELAALRVIAYLLLEKANALLYKEFIETGVAQSLGFSGLNEAKLTTFAFTLKGIYPEYSHELFQEAFRKVLGSMLEQGVDPERVKEYVHQFEVKLLTPVENKGIRVLEECLYLMNHGLELESYLDPLWAVGQAVARLQDRAFVSNLLTKFFLNNQQVVVVRQLMAETQQQQLSPQPQTAIDLPAIKREQEELRLRQSQPQNIEILPKVSIGDLLRPYRVQPVRVEQESSKGRSFEQFHVRIQQKINFYRVVFNFEQLEPSFLSKLTLWVHALNSSISSASLNYNQLASRLANAAANFQVSTTRGPSNSLTVLFEFSALKHNLNEAFSLIEQMILSPKFEKDHTLNVYKGFANEWVETLVQSPMQECLNEAGSYLTTAGYINNSYQRIKDSFQTIKANDVESLYSVSLALQSCPKITLIEHSNEAPIPAPSFLSRLAQAKAMQGLEWKPVSNKSLSVVHNYSVNFCTQQYPGPKYLSREHAHLNLVLELLQHEYLHPRIREQGGAYGSGARIRSEDIIALYSYLDPNSERTFATFDSSVAELLNKDFIPADKFDQAKIMQLGQIDRPKTPQTQGLNQILKGFSGQEYEQFRETLRSCSFSEAIETARKYLLSANKSRCIFGKDSPKGFREEKLKNFLI